MTIQLTEKSTLLENIHLQNSSSGWKLSWNMNSKNCSRRLSALHLKILEDDVEQSVVSTSVIPRKCLMHQTSNHSIDNSYATLGTSKDGCNVLNHLENCTRYHFQLEGEFSSHWKGQISSKMLFTSGTSKKFPLKLVFVNKWPYIRGVFRNSFVLPYTNRIFGPFELWRFSSKLTWIKVHLANICQTKSFDLVDFYWKSCW